ncbi:uncharacterized protein LOC8265859 [Ricinus communis]|uniref:Uncharacterized protein n=1 Tax=Ricinus communis TaxID=3988 RepID=B9RN27_RICCO|nr:uncharacterized protein LOC8265859 [Ricinus communis]EEF47150.1 conserved hypothetical protein [Ricinus communis]|eukprot:XP_002515166.1 uncharacterized protein LOC8265859 [Ricinus communis]
MASSLFHARSDSLPSRPHPLMSELDDHLCRLRACEATSTSSTSISHKLSGLQDLHDCVDKLLLLPLTQQALAQQQNRKWIDELLDGSLRLLDVCNAAKDALLQTKEYTLELQSTIRRRQGGCNGDLSNEVRKYITSRKMAKKAIQKAINNIKGLENKSSISSLEFDNEIATFVSVLREVQAVTLGVLKSFMSFISGTKSHPKPSSWTLVSKLMLHKRIASGEEEAVANEFSMTDAALESLMGCTKYDNMENVQSQLKNLEECIQDLEEGTHSLFRRMIKTRVSLLNIFN